MRLFCKGPYSSLLRYLVPLAFTTIAVDIGEQFLNRSIAQGANGVRTLAAFGLAYTLTKFVMAPMEEMKQVGLVLVHNQRSRQKTVATVVGVGLVSSVLLVTIGKTKLGVWLVDDLHEVGSSVGSLTRRVFLYLCGLPLLQGLAWLHGGILLQWHHTVLVGTASLADIGMQILTVAILLHTSLKCYQTIAIPILAVYAGMSTRMAFTVFGYYYYVHKRLKEKANEPSESHPLTVWRILGFLWPLALVQIVQKVSRPIINLFVARTASTVSKGVEAVAVLSVCYPVSHLPYGWLNDTRALAPAFQNPKSGHPRVPGRKIKQFIAGCGVASFITMAIMFWIPSVAIFLLVTLISVSQELAKLGVEPLRIFSFLPLAVATRAHCSGWLIMKGTTKALSPSAPVRVVVIIVQLFVLLSLGVTGAPMGVAALLSGYIAEATVVVIASLVVRRRDKQKERASHAMVGGQEEIEMLDTGDTSQVDTTLDDYCELDHEHEV